MAYCSTSDVAALTRNLVSGASDFGSSTSPTSTQVTAWLSSGCSVINTYLANKGYAAITATSGAYDLATQANALFGAWMAERSRINARTTTDERTRADMFKRDFEELMKILAGMDLSMLGVSQTGGAKPYAGGISKSDVDTQESDSDRVTPRFKRGLFRNVDRLDPSGNSAS